MNSCLTCHNSSLQIRSPGRKNVRKAGAIKELHIKNTDKLSAKKKSKKKKRLDKLLINELDSGRFTLVNLAFILPPLPTRQTSRAFTIIK